MNRYRLYDTGTGRTFLAYAPNPTDAAWRVRDAKLGGQLIISDAGRYDRATNMIVGDTDVVTVIGDLFPKGPARSRRSA